MAKKDKAPAAPTRVEGVPAHRVREIARRRRAAERRGAKAGGAKASGAKTGPKTSRAKAKAEA